MTTETKIFKHLDRAFWVAWLSLPFIAALRIYYLFTSGYFNIGAATPVTIAIIDFSTTGRVLASLMLCFNIILYVALMAYMHGLTRQFQRGELFVDGTLKYMKRIALLMIVWPFIKVVTLTATGYALYKIGDVEDWTVKFNLDLPLISAGLVILALRLAMSHAIKLHHEAQYTV